MNKTLIVLILLSLFNCSKGKKIKDKTETKKIEKSIEVVSEAEPKRKKLILNDTEKEIAVIATSFHNWYIKNTNDINSKIPVDFVVTKRNNESCIVDYEPYFNQLRALGTISEEFMKDEKKRTKLCAETILKMKWEEFTGMIPDNCDDYLFWTRSQENTDGVEVINMNKVNETWKVKLSLFNQYDNQKNYLPSHLEVLVKKENNEFLIHEINWMD